MFFKNKLGLTYQNNRTGLRSQRLVSVAAAGLLFVSSIIKCGSEDGRVSDHCEGKTDQQIELLCLPTPQRTNPEINQESECVANKRDIDAKLGLLAAWREQAEHDPELTISGIEAVEYSSIAVAYANCGEQEKALEFAEKTGNEQIMSSAEALVGETIPCCEEVK
ncbi:MAG: hypothetical protein AABW86_03315 [Candidatus Micrarchaeota archaeon]